MNHKRSRHEVDGELPLGAVARDAMDHASMIVRDEIKIVRLQVRRYVEHVRGDVAPRALIVVAAGVIALLAALCFAIALFLAIAWAIGSVAWTFLIFAALLTVGAVVLVGASRRPARVTSSEEIERRFPAVKMESAREEQALVRQRRPEAHTVIVEEARREDRDRVEAIERRELAARR